MTKVDILGALKNNEREIFRNIQQAAATMASDTISVPDYFAAREDTLRSLLEGVVALYESIRPESHRHVLQLEVQQVHPLPPPPEGAVIIKY